MTRVKIDKKNLLLRRLCPTEGAACQYSYSPYWLSCDTTQQYVVILSVMINISLCLSVLQFKYNVRLVRLLVSNHVCNCYKMHNECQAGCDTFQEKTM